MNIKKTSKLMIALVAGVTLVKTLMNDKIKKEELEAKKEADKEDLR